MNTDSAAEKPKVYPGMSWDDFATIQREQKQEETRQKLDIHNCTMESDISDLFFEPYEVEVKVKGGESKTITKYTYLPFEFKLNGGIVLRPLTFNGILYYYDSDRCLYVEDKGIIEGWIQSQFDNATLKGYFPRTQEFARLKTEMYKQFLHFNVVSSEEYPFNQYNGFPVNNGVVVFDAAGHYSLEPYKPEMRFTRKIPIDFNPDADTSPMIKILKDWMFEEYMYLIQAPAQAIYQSLPNKTPMKQTYMIVGEGNAGKSAYLDLLTKFWGEKYVSNEQLNEFCRPFNKYNLVDKFMNMGDDLPDVTLNTSNQLKELSGRRCQKVERKHHDAFIADITAVHVFTANKAPEVNQNIDTDDAWWNRWIYLNFSNQFHKISNWFEENVMPNMEGFLLLVLDEVSEIIKNGGRLRFTQEPDVVREIWKTNASIVKTFLEDETVSDNSKDAWISKEEFWNSFNQYVDNIEDGIERAKLKKQMPTSPRHLTMKLARENVTTGERRVNGKKVQAYIGIKWRNGSMFSHAETKDGSIV